MSRPWIKVHASMLHHPGIGRLSDSAYRAWVTCLLMSVTGEELGRCGTVEDVAWQLHWAPEELEAALFEIGDRIRCEEGVLYVRDWSDWQEAESATERQRRHRDKVRGASQTDGDEAPLPECDTPPDPVRDGHVTVTSPECDGVATVTFPRARSRDPDPDKEQDPEQHNQPGVETVVGQTEVIASAKGVTRARARGDPAAPEPPKRDRKAPLKLPPHLLDPDLWASLCGWLQLPPEGAGLSVGTAANLRRLAALYLKAGEGAGKAEADSRAWYRDDWRGRQNQPPTVAQAMDWRARCRTNGHAPPGRETEGPEWRDDPLLSDEDWEGVRAAIRAGDHKEASRLSEIGERNALARAAAEKARGNGSVRHEA